MIGHFLAPPLAPSTTQPQIVINNIQQLPWLAAVIGLTQFIGLICLTLYTFWKTRGDKISERRAEWMHKLVLNELIEKSTGKFREIRSNLLKAAGQLDSFRASSSGGEDPLITTTVTDFQVQLSALFRSAATRLAIVDDGKTVAERLEGHIDTLETSVSDWFSGFKKRQTSDSIASLEELLDRGESTFYRILYDFEFP